MAPVVAVVEHPLSEESGEVLEVASEAVAFVKEGLMVIVGHAAVTGIPCNIHD